MKKIKKLLVLTLTLILSITAFAVTSLATLDVNVELVARYADIGDKIVISVITTKECGAIKATLTYPSTVTFDEESSRFIESAEKKDTNLYELDSTNRKITFVVATNNLVAEGEKAAGDKHWAELSFELNKSDIDDDKTNLIEFSLEDVQVCDVDENLKDNGFSITPAKVTVNYKALRGLGAQYRVENETENIKEAVRFGSRMEVTPTDNAKAAKEIEISGTKYTAVRCGYSWSVGNKTPSVELASDKKSSDIKVADDNDSNTKTSYVITRKYLSYDPEKGYFVYSLAFTDIGEGNYDKPIYTTPFVVYRNNEDEYAVINGNTIAKSYNDVVNPLTNINNELGNEIYKH